jgi:hypothetical protein
MAPLRILDARSAEDRAATWWGSRPSAWADKSMPTASRVSYPARTRCWCATENVRPQPGGRPGRVMGSCCGESASPICGICATGRNGGSNMIRLVHVTTVPQSLTFFQGPVGCLKARGVDVWALSSPGELLDQFAAREGVPVHGLEMPRRIAPLRDRTPSTPTRRSAGCLVCWGRGWRACRCGSTTCTARRS